jgi:hypothetical protein
VLNLFLKYSRFACERGSELVAGRRPGSLVSAQDLAAGYHHVLVAPAFWALLGFQLDGEIYVLQHIEHQTKGQGTEKTGVHQNTTQEHHHKHPQSAAQHNNTSTGTMPRRRRNICVRVLSVWLVPGPLGVHQAAPLRVSKPAKRGLEPHGNGG